MAGTSGRYNQSTGTSVNLQS